ncbi:hypothetical protein E4U17_005649 [Claviceps sp. LM77 group G4]|nr:hypothetical protein E4U17_005649 [Claviceps sp. LM77 group G4]KAG6069893.1 hypothetical protein E4U16_007299 [Claviceps sp. LM84 group G4]KAG6076556.1 hypothetical protein E4U33_001748 [Claviceps sp. LM78 group G4]
MTTNPDDKAMTAALTAIQTKTTALGTTVSTWKGLLPDALPITTTSASLLTQIKHTTTTAEATSTSFSFSDALAVAVATGRLSAVVQTTLRIIIDNKPRFDKLLILSPVVLLNLEGLRRATAELSAAVVRRLPGDLGRVAGALVRGIDEAFGEAIDVYRMF